MMHRVINKLAAALTVILVVVFCTYGLWDGVKNLRIPAKDFAPPTTPSEVPNVPAGTLPRETTTPVTLPAEPETTVPVTLPAEPETTAEPPAPPLCFTTAPEGYFQDALFLGDSRTLGLWEYGDLDGATFFASTGMSVYSVCYEQVSNQSLEALLGSRSFKKIYIMLGINELGYNMDNTVAEYGKLIQWIRSWQPDAIIYIEANLHVSAYRSETDAVFNNENIDILNARIADFADGKQVFYLDVNSLFDDGQGNLADQYTADDTHVLGKYYLQWCDWLTENAIVL